MEEQNGTRAPGTESLIYRLMQTPEYRTEEIVSRLLDAALLSPRQTSEELHRRAENILARINLYGASAIPKNEADLVSWSDLSVVGVKVRSTERTPRKFKECLGCGRRFLAKRANNTTCSPKCRLRASRMKQIAALPPSKAAQTSDLQTHF